MISSKHESMKNNTQLLPYSYIHFVMSTIGTNKWLMFSAMRETYNLKWNMAVGQKFSRKVYIERNDVDRERRYNVGNTDVTAVRKRNRKSSRIGTRRCHVNTKTIVQYV